METKPKRPVYTPMIEQYLQIKRDNPGVLIMYRLGDFYEFFFEDAEKVSKILQLVLTKKAAGNNRKIPMCGIPHHASTSYLAKLVDAGFKVGIVEQVEDVSEAKGLVKREIVQIVTPGSIIDFDDSDHNFIMAIDIHQDEFSVSYADVSTGDIYVVSLAKETSELINFVNNMMCREIVVSTDFDDKVVELLKTNLNLVVSLENDTKLTEAYSEIFAELTNLNHITVATRLINYLSKAKRRNLAYLKQVKVTHDYDFLQIDSFSRINLELTRTVRSDSKYGSLFWVLDETTTAMGRRKLKDFINRPSRNFLEIKRRQNIVNSFIINYLTREETKELFKNIYDLERIVARISFGSANPKDLLRLKTSLKALEKAKAKLSKIKDLELQTVVSNLNELIPIINLLEDAIDEDAPLIVTNGEIFKYGYNQNLDELIELSKGGKRWIANFEEKEKERTGIKNLKIGYNRVFGYYIEITNSALPLVKDEFGYIRKQTTKNGERYINEALKNQEALILSAEERRQQLERTLFNEVINTLKLSVRLLQKTAEAVSELDVYLSLATCAVNYNFVKPTFNDKRLVILEDARHPVLDQLLKRNAFVSNHLTLDADTDVMIITGPNMGGKSTLMRQLALIVIMAQLGSFVPAKSANLMMFDQIFTRIGASDDLVSGQSTFMVEMIETNYALRKATTNSLLLFDEIGRGTATYDGMALAYAMLEYIAKELKVKTLFSTHYHEITSIVDSYPNIKNVHVEVKEQADKITFLYKVRPGPMNKSYGINVARLAGLPTSILNNAEKHMIIFAEQKHDTINEQKPELITHKPLWLTNLEKIDLDGISPIEALLYLKRIKDEGFE